jgi:hypothetical protein
MDFKNLTPKGIKTKSVVVKIEIEFMESTLDFDDITNRIQLYLNYPNSKGISELVMGLLKATNARLWDLKGFKVNEND